MKSLLIVGTDTDVGKTFVVASLVAYWKQYILDKDFPESDRSLGLLKLLQTGIGDREIYDRLFADCDRIEIRSPVRFQAPLAPPIAAEKEGKTIDLSEVNEALVSLQEKHDFVLVEALGGLGSPVTKTLTVAHIAAEWSIPTVLVVPVRLGAISHAVANVALAKNFNIDLKGIILNCLTLESNSELADLTPVDLIQSLTQVPVLGILPYISDLMEGGKLAHSIGSWDLTSIFP